jgi:hypothetical protein
MHGATIKIDSAQQARVNNNYKHNFSKELCVLPDDDR